MRSKLWEMGVLVMGLIYLINFPYFKMYLHLIGHSRLLKRFKIVEILGVLGIVVDHHLAVLLLLDLLMLLLQVVMMLLLLLLLHLLVMQLVMHASRGRR